MDNFQFLNNIISSRRLVDETTKFGRDMRQSSAFTMHVLDFRRVALFRNNNASKRLWSKGAI